MLRIMAILFACSPSLMAQLDGIPGTAVREVNLPPEEALVGLVVFGGDSLYQEDALALVSGLGLGAQHLTSLGTSTRYPSAVRPGQEATTSYTFSLVAPYRDLASLQRKIAEFEKTLPKGVFIRQTARVQASAKTVDALRQKPLARPRRRSAPESGGLRERRYRPDRAGPVGERVPPRLGFCLRVPGGLPQ